jgi:hypothetical protein
MRPYIKSRDNVSNTAVTVKVLDGVVSLSTIHMTFLIQNGMHVVVGVGVGVALALAFACREIVFIYNWYPHKKLQELIAILN